MTPFSAFATTRWTYGAETLSRYNGLASYTIQGQGKPGEAKPLLDRALAIGKQAQVSDDDLAPTRALAASLSAP